MKKKKVFTNNLYSDSVLNKSQFKEEEESKSKEKLIKCLRWNLSPFDKKKKNLWFIISIADRCLMKKKRHLK